MHFRTRKQVVQLIRTSYDPDRKGAKNLIVGSVRLARPELSNELRSKLTSEEIAEFETWRGTQHRAEQLREELAALTLAENLASAARWFDQAGDTEVTRATAANVMANWQLVRRVFVKKGLLD